MKNLRTEIVINASDIAVWKVLTDFDAYREWNPFVHIEGRPALGESLVNTMYLDKNGKSQIFKPEIIRWDEYKGFSWLGSLFVPGLFDGEHYFELERLDDNQVKLIHGENFTGVLSWLIMKLIGEKTLAGFERMNTALKIRVEAKKMH
ncbi:MAG: SRPBCC domain-containing protein [Bacteroidetes bacterium]|nr:MAG: SRPBCC domain-containing protein [Bacteroidota bacterium]